MTEPNERGRIATTARALRARAALWRPVARWFGARRWPTARQWLGGLLLVAVTLVGSGLGLLLGARTLADVGPFHAEFRVTPAIAGDTSVYIPPLGSLHLDTHDGPAHLSLRLGALDQARTQRILTNPGGLTQATETVARDITDGVVRLGAGAAGAAVLGAMLLSALVFRNVRRVAWAGGLSLTLVAGSLGMAAGTFRLSAVEEPRYEGLLVHAPALIGDVQRIADEYERYTEQLQRMVTNVSVLYTAASTLEDFQPDDTMTRVLHVSDLHLNPAAWSIMRTVVEQYDVDLIIDSGDIVDWGSSPESTYLNSIRLMRVPYVYVRGNHDSERLTQARVAEQPNAVVLDNDIAEVAGLTIAGIGDPRFTPDQRTGPHTDEEAQRTQESVVGTGSRLAATIIRRDAQVDIAVVHDPIAAEYLDGVVPLVLAGHRHERIVTPLASYPQTAAELDGEEEAVAEVTTDPTGTLLMVQASTGGAGLRGLEGEHPEPLGLSVLYLNTERQLVAYDDITVGGHGLSEVSVQRHVVELAPEEFNPQDGLDGTPTPEPTG